MPAKSKTKAAATKVKAASQPTLQEAQPPSWPPLQPLADPADLSLTSLLPSQILTISTFWPTTLCKTYISFLRTLPLTTTPGVPKRGHAVRVNDRYQIHDPQFASSLWSNTSLRSLILSGDVDGNPLTPADRSQLWGGDEVLGLNPNIRIYRYSQGQFFDQHYDESNNVMFPLENGKGEVAAKTTWTLLLYLTSPATGCTGGETVFYPEAASKKARAPDPVVAGLEVGMALLHRHGKECMLHEGREVTGGEKWVIRSDLCVRR